MWRSISVIRMKPWRRVRSTRVPMRKRQLHTNRRRSARTHERYTSELMSDSGDQEGGDEDDELRAAEEGAPHVPRLEEVDHRPQEEDRAERQLVALHAHLHKQVERRGASDAAGVGVAKGSG